MLRWFGNQPTRTRRLRERILEGMREVGILFLAFAPLDAGLSQRSLRESAGGLLLFLGLGSFFFGGALVFEWRRRDDE